MYYYFIVELCTCSVELEDKQSLAKNSDTVACAIHEMISEQMCFLFFIRFCVAGLTASRPHAKTTIDHIPINFISTKPLQY
ncbi:hypothetical protein Tsubulata_016101 [Turnera subulata]|uniref:Uncharacterized protein n=1 Tax=Turnera subulata TaxID=218843 RepID=A0A9Q0J360_9ROSI|nr:hypothetical protein Tsubulata_016101 [Turnera subulata]